MSYTIFCENNFDILAKLTIDRKRFDCIYADCIYEDQDFESNWMSFCMSLLGNNSIFYVQTDYHTVAQMKLYLDDRLTFVNWLIYIQEWGGTSKRFFPRKHDDILMYANGNDYKFYPDRIQIPKKTAGTAFDKKGTGMKTPCDVFYDLGNFSTMDKERIKVKGKNVQWQKPLKLMDRLLLPVTDEGDTILDPFMGTGTTGEWCIRNKRHFIGIENDKEICNIAERRLKHVSEMQENGY